MIKFRDILDSLITEAERKAKEVVNKKSKKLLIISYDIDKDSGVDDSSFKKSIKSHGVAKKVQRSVWLLGTSKSVSDVFESLEAELEDNDKLIVARIRMPLQGGIEER